MICKNKPDRKMAVKDAAIRLFAEKGFHATSTAQMAKLAGVSEGIIFYHFQTKDGVLISIFEDIMEELLGQLRRVLSQAETGWQALMGCLDLMQKLALCRSQEVLILLRDLPVGLLRGESPLRMRVLNPMAELSGLIASAIRMGQKDGGIRECDPDKYSVLIVGMISGVNRMRLLQAPPVPEVGRELMDFCRNALATEPASQSSTDILRRTENS